MPSDGNFRFAARYLLLTYAGLPVDCPHDDFIKHISSLRDGARLCLSREKHADGNDHFHAFVDFGTRFETESVTRFDVGQYHPNILPVRRTPGNSLKYTRKDGNILHDDFGPDEQFNTGGKVSGPGNSGTSSFSIF